MRVATKNKTIILTAITAGFILALSFFAFTYTTQAVTTIDTGSGVPIGERQISQEAQSEPTAQKGIVKCGLRDDDLETTDIVESDPCTFCDFFVLFNNILKWVFLIILPTIATLFVLFGGFLLLTSRGNPGQAQKGKDMLIWTLAGYAVIFVGWMVLNSFLSGIGVMEWTGLTGGWWQFSCGI
ncbi:MAG: pilin [Candidatus Spechtbacterales bacterium]